MLDPSPPHNLPIQMTSLLGREQEIAAVAALCQRTDIRLLTLTGPGGSGKTRLALAAATELIPYFSDGVFFVSLAPFREANLVLSSIARTLNIEEGAGQPLARQLQAALQARHLLLVLDNFEHILVAAPLIAELLSVAPYVKVLATSREVLHLYGEHEFVVPSLELPDLSIAQSVEAVSRSAAVALFIERAQAVKPSFSLGSENVRAVIEICARLDALPLALELAAARIKVLTPQEILARLINRFKLLTGGAQNLPMRQRTLRNTLDWSYDLLNEDERNFFRRLGVFAGTWTVRAALSVGILHREEEDALDILTSLVDKSLVRTIEEPEGERRFALLETIREYALEHLKELDELEDAYRCYARYYLSIAEEAEPHLLGREQRVKLQLLDREASHFWAILRWAVERQEAITGLRLVNALTSYMRVRGSVSEGRNWHEEMLALPDTEGAVRLRAKVLYGAGVIASMHNDFARAQERLMESKKIAATAGEYRTWALAAAMLAQLELHQGRYEAALAYAQEGMKVIEEVDDRWCKGILHSIFGKTESKRGSFEQACVRYHVSLVLLREAGDTGNQADVMADLAHTVHLQGRLKTALFLYTKSRQLFEELGDHWKQCTCLNGIGNIQRLQGKYAQAQESLKAGLTLSIALGHRQEKASALTGLGQLAIDQGDTLRGRQLLKESLRLTREIGHMPGMTQLLAGLGELELLRGDLMNATAYYEQCLELTRTLEDKVTMVSALLGLGDIARIQQKQAQTCKLLKQSVHLAWQIGDRPGLARTLEVLAWYCRQAALPERAVLFLGVAETLRDNLQIPLAPSRRITHEQEVTALQEILGMAVFDESWVYGKTISLELALSLVALIMPPEHSIEKSARPIVSYPAGLTAREVDILRLLATGITDARIAETLVISPRTVNTHLRSIYAKLGVSSRSAATRFAVEQGLV